jgi:hypothetical protein
MLVKCSNLFNDLSVTSKTATNSSAVERTVIWTIARKTETCRFGGVCIDSYTQILFIMDPLSARNRTQKLRARAER